MSVERPYLTDTHCHLDFASFDQDRDGVIERARTEGVERILNPGIDLESSRAALKLTEVYAEVYAAVGIHPNSADTWNQNSYHELENLASRPKVVAIGEIGLDYYRKGAPIDVQQRVFRTQLELAGNLGIPVVIHCREAFADLLEILTDWVNTLAQNQPGLASKPGVLHSFTGDWGMAEWAVANKFLIGINGPITYRNADRVHQVAKNALLDNILLETDAPFLPPHPHRGERNEPAHVAIIAGKIAELRNYDTNQVIRSTAINANRLFCWREIH